MERVAGYTESFELTQLIEQLRERLAVKKQLEQFPARELDDVLSRLVIRNQRLRVLHRLERTCDINEDTGEHIAVMRSSLEQLDAQLLQELPSLLEQLPPTS
ncbi:MAG TPA: hypothetical protein VF815_44770 [Myxococcaceae bacterium]|jgi:hypothetical protein